MAYSLTNFYGTTDPAGAIVTLIETQMTAAGWTFVEEATFTQASTARLMRVWKCPGTLNAAGTDFYVGLCKNVASGVYLALRTFEDWDATNGYMLRPVVTGTSTATNTWAALAYGNGTWVAVGSNGIAAYSTDAITWTPIYLPGSVGPSVIAYGAGLFVAVGAGAEYYTSPDGITWTSRTLPASASWSLLGYGAGKFLVLAPSNASFYTSADGITWTSRTFPSGTITPTGIAYGSGNQAVISHNSSAGSTATYYYSTDGGVTWSSRACPAGSWAAITYGNGTYVMTATSSSNAASSTDGLTFTTRTLPVSSTWSRVAYDADATTFLAVAPGTVNAATSPDGVTWTARTIASQPWKMAAGDGKFVLLATGTAVSLTTVDGITYSPQRIAGSAIPTTVSPYQTAGTSVAGAGPLLLELLPGVALVTNTNYDIGILVSDSYLAIGINTNGTGTQILTWVSGLYEPAWTDSQTTNPPLIGLRLDAATGAATCGLSRTVRAPSDTLAFSVTAIPDAPLLGSFTGGAEPATQTIRATRVALIGGNNTAAFNTAGGFRGWLYDAIAVATSAAATIKIADTATVSGTARVCLGTSGSGANGYLNNGWCGFFFDTTAGS